ncbi:predicted protein [Coccidioides posadasii str. Silveira]|uniref:Predicted protein n=2 Tax=Coccidioides posadasii TaxID=199306 RepID=E9CSV4_COCPS|nr:predicted protein [Coccidioides posadasii str. Silveira]KMM67439.1 hypothetical protein CPAG_03773 [Coccidioides posadasii RMSCC 3488]
MNRRSVAPDEAEKKHEKRKLSIFDVQSHPTGLAAAAAAGGGNNNNQGRKGREGRRRCGYLLRSRVSAQQTCICRPGRSPSALSAWERKNRQEYMYSTYWRYMLFPANDRRRRMYIHTHIHTEST